MNFADRIIYLLEKYNEDYTTMEIQTYLDDYVALIS